MYFKDYEIKYTTKSLVNIENRLGVNALNAFLVATEGKFPKISDIMVILHEGINAANHGVKLEKVYDLFDEYRAEGGTLISLINLIIEAFDEAGLIPKDDEVEEPGE